MRFSRCRVALAKPAGMLLDSSTTARRSGSGRSLPLPSPSIPPTDSRPAPDRSRGAAEVRGLSGAEPVRRRSTRWNGWRSWSPASAAACCAPARIRIAVIGRWSSTLSRTCNPSRCRTSACWGGSKAGRTGPRQSAELAFRCTLRPSSGSYRRRVISPVRTKSTASSIAEKGGRNHSAGFTSPPN